MTRDGLVCPGGRSSMRIRSKLKVLALGGIVVTGNGGVGSAGRRAWEIVGVGGSGCGVCRV